MDAPLFLASAAALLVLGARRRLHTTCLPPHPASTASLRAALAASSASSAGAVFPLTIASTSTLPTSAFGGAPFLVSAIDGAAARSKGARPPSARRVDAFAPPLEPRTHVAALACGGGEAPSHDVVLNKFPVSTPHVVIVAREFAPQTDPLTPPDVLALWTCLGAFGGVGFYNCGVRSGASQVRRHTQVLSRAALEARAREIVGALPPGAPAPLVSGALLPIDVAIAAHRAARGWSMPAGEPFTLQGFAFPHAVVLLGGDLDTMPFAAAAARVHSLYTSALALLKAGGVRRPPDEGGSESDDDGAAQPHNVLLTREWLLVVPRTRERTLTTGASVNALAFAGLLLGHEWGAGGDPVADFAALCQ